MNNTLHGVRYIAVNDSVDTLIENKDILEWKYGPGNWPKGPGTEYNKIVKWIERYLRYYRGW